MIKKLVVGAFLVSNLISAPVASASIGNSFQRSISLRAYVPIVCRTTFTSNYSTVNENLQELGTVNEFCNSARGYRVIIQVSGNTENAGTIYFGGQAFDVNGSQIVVTDVNGPGRLDRTLAYEHGENSISAMSIRIEPKYA